MAKTDWVGMLLVLCCEAAASAEQARVKGKIGQKGGHEREYWKNVVKNHYAIPFGEEAFPLARELSGYLGSYTWIVSRRSFRRKNS
jgi:hypothetical protein